MKLFRRGRSVEPAEDADPADDGPVSRLLEDRRAFVEAELGTAAGGASLCSISKVAGSVPTAKYLEGRLAVLMEVRRQAGSTQETAATVDQMRIEWQAELARVADGDFGPDWVAYRAGGVDELDELATTLGAA